MESFAEFLEENPNQTLMMIRENADRYSVEVNFRTTTDEALKNYAKIVLGYVSAGIKQHNFHVKHVYTDDPLRILISSRNWDDGEWVALVSWDAKNHCFIVSKGYYNKDRRTVSLQSSEKCDANSAFEITTKIYNLMHHLKKQPDRHVPEPIKLKRGPKGGF